MEKIIRNFAIGLVLLIILAPLGLIATGTAFGEWGPQDIKDMVGFVPQGLEKLSGLWNAPMPDYGFPGSDSNGSMTSSAAAYILAAVIGVAFCGSVLFLVGKRVAKD